LDQFSGSTADGRLTHRERRTGLDSVLQVDSLRYDPQGRVLVAITQSAAWSHVSNRATNAYAGLGAVLASEVRELNTTNWEAEEFRVDRVGSVLYNRRRSRDDLSTPPERSSFDLHGLLTVRRGDPSPFCGYSPFRDTLYQAGDGGPTGGGNVIRSGEVHIACDQWPTVPGIRSQLATNSFYTLDNRLAVIEQNNTVQSPPPTPPLSTDTWEEYWYDALGRRVLARSRRETVGAMFACEDWTVCISFVQRTVWDGDQVLVEERTSGLDAVTGGAPSYGTVRYVHLLGMDAPVAVLDNRFTNARVLHYNWRGLAEASSWTTGAPADDQVGGGSTFIAWPAGQGVYYKRGGPDPTAGMTRTWIGSLPQNGQDGTGMLYRRNRYFDPASGRFTQEDPIGLAGGLNLYGFAGGDPVNFSDPFGLMTCPPCFAEWNREAQAIASNGGTTKGMIQVGSGAWLAVQDQTIGRLAGGVSGTLGNVTCGANTAGSGCGVSINTPSAGASLDVGIKFRNASGDPVTGGVTYGIGKHLGLTVTNGTVMLNIGVSTPTASPVTATVDLPSTPGQGPPGSMTQSPDATAVRRVPAPAAKCPGPSCPLE
jgi:RHS repeat-associated protein